MLKNELTVVIICYDPYADAISLNPLFLKKNWADCSANIIYVSSKINFADTGYQFANTNGDLSYFKRIETALENVNTNYVLLLLEDYIIDKPVNEQLLKSNIDYMKQNNIQFLELFTIFNRPKGTKIGDYLLVNNNNMYRINLQAAIFSKNILMRLVKEKPITAWDAELALNSGKFNDIEAYFALNNSFSIINYIDKGMVTRKAYKFLKKEKLWSNQREVMPVGKTIKKYMVNKFSKFVPQFLKNKFKKDGKIYKG